MVKKAESNLLKFSVNTKVYSLEAVLSTCYVFIDRAYLFLDGDPKKSIVITMKAKNPSGTEK